MTGAPDRLLPDKIDLPGGGWVKFRDEDTITGRDVFTIRAAIDPRKTLGANGNDLLQAAMRALVEAWEIPGLPNLPVPAADEALKPAELLPWRVLKAIERAVTPMANALRREAVDEPADTGPGSPTPPGSA